MVKSVSTLGSEITQMVEQGLDKIFSSGPEFKSQFGFLFYWEEQLFAINPGQDLNYHAETHLSDIHKSYG